MDAKTLVDHIQEAFESLEDDSRFDGPYTDEFEIVDDGVIIPFEDGTRFRLHIQTL